MRMLRVSLMSLSAALCFWSAGGVASAQPTAPTGACCIRSTDGTVTCRTATLAACRSAGGVFRGPRTVCDPNPCVPPPPPTGACCTRNDDGTRACNVTDAPACQRAHGAFRGAGTTCDPDPCVPATPPSGACCTRDDAGQVSCAVTTRPDCRRARGLFRGAGSVCDPSPCPPAPAARGACCLPASETSGPRCVILTEARCTDAGGRYGGDRSTCRSANCPTACACDWDRDGLLSVRDLFSFLHDYMAGNADFDGDGSTTDVDLNAFMACFQSPPEGCTRRGPG